MSLNQRMAIALGFFCLALVGFQFWRVAGVTTFYYESLFETTGRDRVIGYLSAAPNRELLNFWAKLGFSLLLGGASLFIVLKATYPQKTQDWAFSVLTLIAGVWIGTVS